jgi:type I restriction enzyme S subunit
MNKPKHDNEQKTRLIPTGWVEVNIEDIMKGFYNGYALKKSDFKEEGIPVIKIGNISLEGRFMHNPDTLQYCSHCIFQDRKTCQLKKGDMIIAMTDVRGHKPLIGRTAIIDKDRQFFLNQRVGRIEVDEKLVDKWFLHYYFNWEVFRKNFVKIIGKSAQANISQEDIKKSKIMMPKSIKEQKKIASIIYQVDEKIKLIDEQIKNIKKVKDRLINKLFTKGVSNKHYKKTKAGKLPVNWIIERLGNYINDIKNGVAIYDKHLSISGYKIIRKGDVKRGSRLKLTDSVMGIRKSYAKIRSNALVNKRYLVLTTRDLFKDARSIGLMAQIKDNKHYILAQGTSGIRLSKGLNPAYLAYLSNTPYFRKLVRKTSVGSTQQHLRIDELLNIEIPIPTLKEQKKIVKILNAVYEKINILKKKRKRYKKLKNCLMLKLFSGEIRINF